jgi:hypothetical protein
LLLRFFDQIGGTATLGAAVGSYAVDDVCTMIGRPASSMRSGLDTCDAAHLQRMTTWEHGRSRLPRWLLLADLAG